jgi:hypothetical protein
MIQILIRIVVESAKAAAPHVARQAHHAVPQLAPHVTRHVVGQVPNLVTRAAAPAGAAGAAGAGTGRASHAAHTAAKAAKVAKVASTAHKVEHVAENLGGEAVLGEALHLGYKTATKKVGGRSSKD